MSLHRSSTHSYHPMPPDDDSMDDSWHNSHRHSYHRAPPPPLEDTTSTPPRTNSATRRSDAEFFTPTSTTSTSPFHSSSIYYDARDALSTSSSAAEETSSSNSTGFFGDPEGDAFADMNINSPLREEEKKDEVEDPFDRSPSLRSTFSSSEPLPVILEKEDAESIASQQRESFQNDPSSSISDQSNVESIKEPLMGKSTKDVEKDVTSKPKTPSIVYLYAGIQCLLLSFIFMILAIVYRDAGKQVIPSQNLMIIRIPPEQDASLTTRNIEECSTLCSAVSCCHNSQEGCNNNTHPHLQCEQYQSACQDYWNQMELPDSIAIQQSCQDLTLVSDWVGCYRQCQPVRCCFDRMLECFNTTSTMDYCSNYLSCGQVFEEQAKILVINNGAIPNPQKVEEACTA